MLYLLSLHLAKYFTVFNVFKYITLRAGLAILTAIAVNFIFAKRIIAWFKLHQHGGQPIRENGPASHIIAKKGTPTMGGAIILLGVALGTLLWADLYNHFIWIVLFVTFSFGFLGLIDDYLKVTKRNSKGVSGKIKLLFQLIITVIAYFWLMPLLPATIATTIAIPFLKNIHVDLSIFYVVFMCIVVIGSSNAVNITDGLDGLATVPIIITAGCFGIIAYLVGNSVFSHYLLIPFISGMGEITIFCAALLGAGLGFLWYNAPPAQIFMGDTGSLAFGGALGIISIMVKHEILLAIIGGLFVIEAISVILQVYYFKLTKGKRIFLMAPLHHHFEKKGWAETTIVIRFWIIAVIFALIGMSTLKLR